jgi:signal transduction histidine kinase
MGEKAGEPEWLAYIVEARDRERARISRLLHDEVGQVLSAAGLQLDLLRMDCAQAPGLAARIGEAQKLLEQAVGQVRSLSYALNPAVVERAGLKGALEELIERSRRAFSGTLEFAFDGELRLPGQAAEACYRIVELALENALRHAGAGRIEVRCRRRGPEVIVEIRDDGCGFAAAPAGPPGRGLGLRLIKHLARRGGLELFLASEPEKGTIVRAIYRSRQRAAAGGAGRGRRG